ncbi:MAG: fibronectin type III domain-containing protein [Acidobacteriota bacterium]|nr:fibronectin type III domain-containing protein [Acidobacteriota bacterium]
MTMRIGLGLGTALAGALSGILAYGAVAQGTKVWSVTRYDEMERGTTEGVAIRSDGRMEAGPATSLLYQTGGNYVWAVAEDAAGNAYVGMGGTAAGGAVVMRIAPDGKATKVFEGKELGVQSLRLGTDGQMYAATSPDGKVYRLGVTPADAAAVFDAAVTEEKPKYLWDVLQATGGDLYVAAGAPAVVYRVPAKGGKAEVGFRTVDQHIRCLLMAADGTLWAGSDGSGVIYKFNTRVAGSKPFAAYAAAKKEITALAMDAAGNVYSAGVGTRPAAGAQSPGLPPLPVTGAVGVTITFSQAGSANAATQNTLIPEGSEIYRIAADGSPVKLLALKEDVVYALAYRAGSLLAATGNRGRVYRMDPAVAGQYTDVAHLEASQGMAFAAGKDGLLVATSNSGKVFRLDDRVAANATYTSEVFDAQGFSQWGRVEVLPEVAAGFDLFVRSGNVESPLMGWSDWAPVAKSGAVTVPGGRFAQWKAALRTGADVHSVGLNYLQKNVAPVVDEVMVLPGARVTANAAVVPNQTVQVSFPVATNPNVPVFTPDANAQPLVAQKDKSAVTVRWAAHDDNGDDLVYSVWYRGVGEKNWRMLKDKISEKYLSFDSSLLPDGTYEVRVVASDAPVHTDADSQTGERVSGSFVVDTTPPVPGALTAVMVAGTPAKIHATFSAKDATSPIERAEYSVDAGPWQYLEPVGRVSDSLEERYDFTAAVPAGAGDAAAGLVNATEHVIAVRVYDRYENVVAVKAVVR